MIPINLHRLDLVSLDLVVQCAQAGSISSASARCRLSVMGASERLRRLEQSLGKRLFLRRRHGLELTPAGDVVVRAANRILLATGAMLGDVASAPEPAPAGAENSGRRRKAA